MMQLELTVGHVHVAKLHVKFCALQSLRCYACFILNVPYRSLRTVLIWAVVDKEGAHSKTLPTQPLGFGRNLGRQKPLPRLL
jgi:hypothetical protein